MFLCVSKHILPVFWFSFTPCCMLPSLLEKNCHLYWPLWGCQHFYKDYHLQRVPNFTFTNRGKVMGSIRWWRDYSNAELLVGSSFNSSVSLTPLSYGCIVQRPYTQHIYNFSTCRGKWELSEELEIEMDTVLYVKYMHFKMKKPCLHGY